MHKALKVSTTLSLTLLVFVVCFAMAAAAAIFILHGDRQGARPLMEKASIDCPKSFLEYRMAQFEMEKLP